MMATVAMVVAHGEGDEQIETDKNSRYQDLRCREWHSLKHPNGD
ncbi:MAG: hypothetical protein AAF921_26905 [Cyanobacteria bacterium P01_D01_bin.44]